MDGVCGLYYQENDNPGDHKYDTDVKELDKLSVSHSGPRRKQNTEGDQQKWSFVSCRPGKRHSLDIRDAIGIGTDQYAPVRDFHVPFLQNGCFFHVVHFAS
jgi:hypothetical protein